MNINISETINENKSIENIIDNGQKIDDKLEKQENKNSDLIDDLKDPSKVEKPQKKKIELLKQLIQEIDHEKHNQEDLKSTIIKFPFYFIFYFQKNLK